MSVIIRSILFILIEITSIAGYANAVWNQKSNLPGAGRHRGTGIAIADKGYIGLGHVNGTGVNIVYSDWWEFDPATNAWTQKADYPTLNYGALAFATSTKGYVGGGVFLNDEFYEFDPLTNTWSQINSAPVNASDNIAFSINNLGYISNGATIYEYNPNTDLWTTKQNTPANINAWSSVCVAQNSAYIKINSNLYEYKASTDSWIQKNGYPGLSTGGGVAFSVNNKCYFLLGYIGSLGNVTKEMWEYDPATNNWHLQPEFSGTSRRFAAAFSINNIGYVGIGTNGINFNDFWEYNRILEKENYSPFLVNLYPNPSTDFIVFTFSNFTKHQNNEITIYDMLGNIVKQINCTESVTKVQLDDVPVGNYCYAIKQSGASIKNGQFIVN